MRRQGLPVQHSSRRGAATPPTGTARHDVLVTAAQRRVRHAPRLLWPAPAASRAHPAASTELSTPSIDPRGAAVAGGYTSARSAHRVDAGRAPPAFEPEPGGSCCPPCRSRRLTPQHHAAPEVIPPRSCRSTRGSRTEPRRNPPPSHELRLPTASTFLRARAAATQAAGARLAPPHQGAVLLCTERSCSTARRQRRGDQPGGVEHAHHVPHLHGRPAVSRGLAARAACPGALLRHGPRVDARF